ncbi:choice-of-anchor B domain-containing protein [Salinibacter ruber]|uniref:choice-of-anchor B family protein n=2 Tax=Salinibacter ruber TaxID=146919 RepID=UPI00216A478B|nr:choice-of-anchor B family protein [Salinibacter ruber]MCS4191741.1 choice-of-anchor B domain-containing protein [Salinibacter ruber]
MSYVPTQAGVRKRLFFPALLLLIFCAGHASAQSTLFGTRANQIGFGEALKIENGHMFAGATQSVHSPGRVYVYESDGNGGWTEKTFLEAEDGEVQDRFGAAVDAEGEHLLVGAPSARAAYLIRDGEDSWVQQSRLTPSDSTEGFGKSVVLTDDHIYVGSSSTVASTNGDTTRAPAVHVFEEQSDGSWSESAVVHGMKSGDTQFAESMVVSPEHLFVSSPERENGGAVVVFEREANELNMTQTLTADELDDGSRFGSALQWAEGQVFVGAPLAYSATGTIYTFSLDSESGDWMQGGRLLPPDGTRDQLFGDAITHDGTDLWAGAPGAAGQTGALYRYQKNDGTWSMARRVLHSGAKSGDGLGATLAASDGVVTTGMAGGDNNAGTVAIYSSEEDNWTRDDAIAPQSGKMFTSITGETRNCEDGEANIFDCEGVDLESFLPIREIGGERGINVNDVWGWTDPSTDIEYALVGRDDGASFVDVSNPNDPVLVGTLPHTEKAQIGSHRDIKVYKNHAFIVSDGAKDHGMQVFDLTRLRDVDADQMPVTFDHDTLYDQVNSVHNVVINKQTGYAYAVGSNGGSRNCSGALHMINIQDPLNPTFEGCFVDKSTGRSGSGRTHDAQCVVYEGPDPEYQGREICIGYNGTAISVADVTDKDNPKAISTGSYPDYGYVHQGWFTEDQRYIYMNDEADELQGKADQTRTLVWDMKDLDNPRLVNEIMLPEESTDHNLYVKGNKMYQSNYKSGLRILDISDRENPEEVAHFDTQPYDRNKPGFQGSWSNYPYFESGIIIVSSIGEGLFVLSPSDREL